MKRSAQIGLVVMGALGATTAGGYFLNGRDQGCQARAQSNPQAAPGPNCRRSLWSSSSGHGSGSAHPVFANPSSATPPAAKSAPSSSGSAERGGFGGMASRIGGFFSGS
jgi:uncharacterized protein YgiB involved in biofilm formation